MKLYAAVHELLPRRLRKARCSRVGHDGCMARLEQMRDVTWLVAATPLAITLAWACGESSVEPGASSTSGGGSQGAANAVSAGTGCSGDCPAQCDAPGGSVSKGSCVTLGGPNNCNP